MAIYRTLYYADVSVGVGGRVTIPQDCLLYTSPSPRDRG